MSATDLWWCCPTCGDNEAAKVLGDYSHGDKDKCECGGWVYVLTLSEAASVEQARALGRDHVALCVRLASATAGVENSDIYAEVKAERERAHAKHGESSMERMPPYDMTRLTVLLEEVGEVAREYNEAKIHDRPIDRAALRKELIQVAAMAAAWADALSQEAGGAS